VGWVDGMIAVLLFPPRYLFGELGKATSDAF